MMAEVRLIVASREARLILKKGETLVEDELWRFERPISLTEAKQLAEAAFHDAFDLMQHAVHSDGDS
jgi:CYTH domain-containing protein